MKNIIEYRIKTNGFGSKSQDFLFAVVSVLDKCDIIMSKHKTEKAGISAQKRYSKESNNVYELAKI